MPLGDAVAAALMMAAALTAAGNQRWPIAAAGLWNMCQEQPEHPLTAGAALKACAEKCVQIMASRSRPSANLQVARWGMS